MENGQIVLREWWSNTVQPPDDIVIIQPAYGLSIPDIKTMPLLAHSLWYQMVTPNFLAILCRQKPPDHRGNRPCQRGWSKVSCVVLGLWMDMDLEDKRPGPMHRVSRESGQALTGAALSVVVLVPSVSWPFIPEVRKS